MRVCVRVCVRACLLSRFRMRLLEVGVQPDIGHLSHVCMF